MSRVEDTQPDRQRQEAVGLVRLQGELAFAAYSCPYTTIGTHLACLVSCLVGTENEFARPLSPACPPPTESLGRVHDAGTDDVHVVNICPCMVCVAYISFIYTCTYEYMAVCTHGTNTLVMSARQVLCCAVLRALVRQHIGRQRRAMQSGRVTAAAVATPRALSPIERGTSPSPLRSPLGHLNTS